MAAEDVSPVRAEVVVDLDAIAHNVRLFADRAAASGAATLVAVKADGYGHGAVQVADAALRAGATWLGSCSLAEALALREAGIAGRILAWLDLPTVDYAPGIAADVDISVASIEALDAVLRTGQHARLHLKIDTGLSRGGAVADEWPALVERAADAHRDGAIELVAVWSHLACADEPGHPSIDLQAKRFDAAYQVVVEHGLRPLRHIANSAATLTRPDLHFDLVRVGIGAYGLNPVPQQEDLRPAMSFHSSIAFTKRVPAGESVSYGHTWTAPMETTLALIPVGYADGVPRGLSGRLDVWIAGERRPIVGRVSMDQIVADIGDADVRPGEPVVLFGDGAHGEPTAREWADRLGTIDYEIVTGMYRPRVSRRYLGTTA
ncbi:MAG TPA: alanine racemase [Pseudonocardiaceae bacterium]|jgi:alanine racemase